MHREVIATRLRDMSFPVIAKHVFDHPEERRKDPTLRGSTFWSHLAHDRVVGSGAYKFVEWKTDDQIVVERWEDYPFTKPRFQRLVIKILPDPNVALLLFKKGQLHETQLSAQQFSTQTNDDEFRRVGVKALGPLRIVSSLAWNLEGNPFFADVRVRRAMSHAFNRDKFLRDALYGLYPPSHGIFDVDHWAYNPDIELDPVRSRAGRPTARRSRLAHRPRRRLALPGGRRQEAALPVLDDAGAGRSHLDEARRHVHSGPEAHRRRARPRVHRGGDARSSGYASATTSPTSR